MVHEPLGSLEAMLSIDALSALEGRPVMGVDVEQWTPPPYHAASGSEFLKVRSTTPNGSSHYVVKRTSFATDIIRRLTDDYDCRERLIWQHGLFDRLPARIESPTLACAPDGEGWALLMRDVNESLQRLERWRPGGLYSLNLDEICAVVDALVEMHARFYADPALQDPVLGLCTMRQLFAWSSTDNLEQHAGSFHDMRNGWEPVVDRLREGWTLLDRLETHDVIVGLRELHVDPRPFLDALGRFPSTLVHGDPRRENIGLTAHEAPHLVLIDWQFVSALPPAVDLAWLLNHYGPSAVPEEVVISRYREQLAHRLGDRFDQAEWEPQLRLALLGQCLRALPLMLYSAYKAENHEIRAAFQRLLPWWCEQAHLGLMWL